jgi:hypothetical protein
MSSNDHILDEPRHVRTAAPSLNLAAEELDDVAGIDSRSMLTLVTAVEKHFHLTLTEAELRADALPDLPRHRLSRCTEHLALNAPTTQREAIRAVASKSCSGVGAAESY